MTDTSSPPASTPPDFQADPEAVRVVAEGHRLTFGHQCNPAFATEISLIEPLPHQRIAVYERMLRQTRLRFLLADDAGAGKTIMTGLYVREMLMRRLIRRVLIVPPAGLLGNWEREMRTLFSLPFRVARGADAKAGNPFVGPDSDLLIVSLDTLAGEHMFSRLQEPQVKPYDLVVFDEAHKLSADRDPDFTVRRTDRYRLAEALAGAGSEDPRWQLGWACRHLLLLTATPHMGKTYPYYALWRLLEPQVLSTPKAFEHYPPDARNRHFIRRTKEEMVRFDGSPIYPKRVSDTLSYDLTQGEDSEQQLYDEVTDYIQNYYNQARILNRTAACFAMSIFQRRLASSTYAILCSLQRRLEKLQYLIEAVETGMMNLQQLAKQQGTLASLADPLDAKTADEEQPEDGLEESEAVEDRLLQGVTAESLDDLTAEHQKLQELVALAKRVYAKAEESKLEKLLEVLKDPRYQNEKLIIFTEHRDTLVFLVHRLEAMGFTGKIAQIHGGMDYPEREKQIEFFRKPVKDGGAAYLVATDAAGEGINLQFCWLMVNYDIPWNPARLEQRMGRIHRYGQQHDPVLILNLVAGKTREGRVLLTLLEKLERIRQELGSDKVFDVIGRLFQDVPLKQYLELAVTEEGAQAAQQKIEATLTKEQVDALQAREKCIYGDGGDVRKELPSLRDSVGRETYRRLLPAHMRRFVEKAAPLLGLQVHGDLDGYFRLRPQLPGALDPLSPFLEAYPPEVRDRLTVYRPRHPGEAIFLHPGEPFFDRFREHVCARLSDAALRGAVFIDPSASKPYLFHLAWITVKRKADPDLPRFKQPETLEWRLVGLRQEAETSITECPPDHLLSLRNGQGIPQSALHLLAFAGEWCAVARAFAEEQIAGALANSRRQELLKTLPEREKFLRRGYDYEEAELLQARFKLTERAMAGDPRARAQLAHIKQRLQQLDQRRKLDLLEMGREPGLITPGECVFLAHALVLPPDGQEDQRRQDADIEAVAMRVAREYEERCGAQVFDVSTPAGACAADLGEYPGFDLLSRRPGGEERAIEVKGRAGVGAVELTENEWMKAFNLRERYWLYVVFHCAGPDPQLICVQGPLTRLPFQPKGGVIIGPDGILQHGGV